MTDAQRDTIDRLRKKHGRDFAVLGEDHHGRVHIRLPGEDEPAHRRLRVITQSGVAERHAATLSSVE